MEGANKNIRMRELTNEAIAIKNKGKLAVACKLAMFIVDNFLMDSDFTQSDIDVAEALLKIFSEVRWKKEVNINYELKIIRKLQELRGEYVLPIRDGSMMRVEPKRETTYPFSPTRFASNQYHPDWYDLDFFIHIDGSGKYRNHPCKQTWEIVQPFLTSYQHAIDIGCREGVFTRFLGKYFLHVYCFDPRCFPHFSYNVHLENVTHFTCALGSEEGYIQMLGGSHQPKLGQGHNVRCYRLDDFGFSKIDLIKIDVEGFEEKVIRGGEKTIRKNWPVIIIEQNEVCLAGDSKYDARDYLVGLDYKIVATGPGGIDLIMKKQNFNSV